MPPAPIRPVIIGTDIGAYSIARSFHEACGARSIIISGSGRGPINDSRILVNEFLGKGAMNDPQRVLEALRRIGRDNVDKYRLILMVNSDQDVEMVAEARDELSQWYTIPLASAEAIARANDKSDVADVAQAIGQTTPKSIPVSVTDRSTWKSALEAIGFPAIMKPREGGTEYNRHYHSGMRKVWHLTTMEESHDALDVIARSGFTGEMLLQELIPGDDTASWVVNGYVDRRGVHTVGASGQVLLGLHQPGYIGNAGIIDVKINEELIDAGQAIVSALGLTGFYSLDVKIDTRTGKPVWLDVNPRIGRGNYYINVGGLNPIAAMLDDIAGVDRAPQRASRRGIFAFVPTVILGRYVNDESLLAEVKKVMKKRPPVHPLDYAQDNGVKRRFYRYASGFNQLRDLRTYYPHPNESGI